MNNEKTENERLQFALDAAGIGTWELDPVQNKVVWDDRCRELFGYPQNQQISYEEVLTHIHPDDVNKVDEAVKKALDPTQNYDYEVRYRTIASNTSKVRWVLSKGKAFFDKNGTVTRFAGTAQDVTEAMIDREKLVAAERMAQVALEGSNSGYFHVEFKTGEMDYSPGYVRVLTGTEQKGLTHEAFVNHVHPDDLPIRTRAFEIASKTGRLDYEARVVWNDGSIHWMRAKGTFLNDPAGKPYLLAGTVHETTGEHLNRDELERSEARFRSLIEQAPVATCLFVGPEMRIEVANEIMIGYWGKDESVIGKPLLEAVPELKGQAFPKLLTEVYTTGKTHVSRAAEAFLEVNGILGTYYFDFSYKPLRNAAGEVYAIMDMAVDVTEQVIATRALQESELFSRSVIDHSPVAKVVFIGEQMIIRTVNENMLAMMGRDASIIGKPFMEAMPEFINTPLMNRLRHVFTTGETFYQPEEKLALIRFGEPYTGYYNYIYKALRNTAGEIYGVITTATEVTEQVLARHKIEQAEATLRTIQVVLEKEVKERTEELRTLNQVLTVTNEELNEANKQLLRSNEELAQYAYVASHDLQEPLRKIMIFSGMLETQEQLTSESRALVGRIAGSAGRMSQLIRDLLEFSRLLKSEPLVKPVDLSAALAAVINDFELTIQDKKATINIGTLPVIEAVGLQMNQLFYNLMSNALKFTRTDAAPLIEINSRTLTPEEVKNNIPLPIPGSAYYHISFSDNGIGFEQHYADQIFEVFKRLHGRDAYPGSGIGLALCKRIIANHNGQICVKSDVGSGTTFHLVLPEKNPAANE